MEKQRVASFVINAKITKEASLFYVCLLQTLGLHQQVDEGLVLEVMFLLIPKAEVGIVAPGSPGNARLSNTLSISFVHL